MNITRPLSIYQIENTKDYLYVHNGHTPRECNACFKEFIPTINDISTKRPSTFYKTCFKCRDRFSRYRREKEARDKALQDDG